MHIIIQYCIITVGIGLCSVFRWSVEGRFLPKILVNSGLFEPTGNFESQTNELGWVYAD